MKDLYPFSMLLHVLDACVSTLCVRVFMFVHWGKNLFE